jgi:hypothetical protein
MMTADSARDVGEYRGAVLGRLRALSHAHNLLIDGSSQTA